ncbi:MAG: sulfite exporter TauE/SafE family protein [Bilophila sp.]
MLTSLAVYLIGGAVTGILAGLLGVGGGIVIVPLLNVLFAWQGFPADQIQHLSLGTSMAAIIFTSISSFMAHNRRGAVCWSIWRAVTPGILVGTFGGTWIAAGLSTGFLRGFFACFLVIVGTQMLLNMKPKPGRELPGGPQLAGVGGGIGLLSSFVGIGGGTISVPFMSWCNVPIHVAVGTSAAIGLPIALAGAAGYILNGWGVVGLPAGSLGFVYLPALAGLVAASMLTAPLGVRLGHSLPVAKLKRIFGIFIYIMAARMIWTLLG